jgi:hypothetical protein
MEWLIVVLIFIIIILIKHVIPKERKRGAYHAINPSNPLPSKEFYADGSLKWYRYFDNELGSRIVVFLYEMDGE